MLAPKMIGVRTSTTSPPDAMRPPLRMVIVSEVVAPTTLRNLSARGESMRRAKTSKLFVIVVVSSALWVLLMKARSVGPAKVLPLMAVVPPLPPERTVQPAPTNPADPCVTKLALALSEMLESPPPVRAGTAPFQIHAGAMPLVTVTPLATMTRSSPPSCREVPKLAAAMAAVPARLPKVRVPLLPTMVVPCTATSAAWTRLAKLTPAKRA